MYQRNSTPFLMELLAEFRILYLTGPLQYAPELTPAIKRVSDNLPPGQKGKFLLTGSADIFSSARTQEALPGHMARVELAGR